MKLMIDIPEECLKNISNAFEFGEDITKRTIDIILDSITKSTPIPDNVPTVDVLDKIRDEMEQVKSIMNEEIINHDRKDLINFVNGLNQSLVIINKYKAESEEE